MKTYNRKEIAEKIENTSLAHAVLEHLQVEEVEDKEFQQLIKQAQEVFAKIEEQIKPYMYE